MFLGLKLLTIFKNNQQTAIFAAVSLDSIGFIY